MQTWIRANIGKLIARITGAETDITALNNAVGMPYNAPLNLSTRVYNLEIAPGYSDDYSMTPKAVGKWVDGKTIYKRTTNVSTIDTVNGRIVMSNRTGYHYSTLIRAETIFTYTDSTYNLQFCGDAGNSSPPIQHYIDRNSGDIFTDFNNQVTYSNVRVTYWYTEEVDS